jgi:serine/threonine protein kinase
MAGESDDLDKLFESVADGESVNWDALERDAPDDQTRALLRQLRLIAEVGDVHRSQVDEVPTPDAALTAPAVWPGDNWVPPPRAPHVAHPPGPDGGVSWGHLLLVRKIGEGSFGEVYQAHDTWLDHPVALKLLKPEAESRVSPSQLLHEARKLARVRHVNVVTVHGADRHNGRVGFWMDFVDGETLAARVQRGRLSPGEATSVGQEVCRALAAVHQSRMIHRDVKAQNVMRAHDGGRIILMDFGAGEFVGDSLGSRGQGTPLYLAPEVLNGGNATVQSDIYAVGVLLYHLVTNRYPVEGGSLADIREAHARGRRRRLRDERPDLPESFIAIVERATDPEPARRYASAGEMEAKLAGEPPTGPEPLPKISRTRKPVEAEVVLWPWQRWLPLAAGALLIVFTLAGAITSTYYYVALGLSEQFRSESALSWPLWGLRALLAPLVLAGGGMAVGVALLTVVYRSVFMQIGTLRELIAPLANRVSDLIAAVRRLQAATTAPLLFLAQCALLALTWLWFRDLMNGFDSLLVPTTTGDLTPLSTANATHQRLFRQVMSVEFLVMTAAWLALLWRRHERHERGGWLSIGGGIAATFSTLILLVIPYRILSHSEHERVVHKSETCYLIAQRQTEALLFCPRQTAPRNRVVRLTDPDLERGGPEESVFSRLGPVVDNEEVKR